MMENRVESLDVGGVELCEELKPSKSFGVRHVQFSLIFFVIFISSAMKTVLSTAIIAMIDKSPLDSSIPTYPEWRSSTDIILSSIFWGYIVTQIGAGQLAERFGPKWILSLTMSIGAISCVAIPPMAASLGENGVMLCRIVLGLSQGFVFPSINHLLSKWVPETERSIVTNVILNGTNLGIALSNIVSGYLSETLGWPLAFHLHGALAILWVLAWSWFGGNSPADYSGISKEELKHIETNILATTSFDRGAHGTPWLEIIKSKPVWALLIVQAGVSWALYTLFTELPTYLDNIMDFSLRQSSLLSSLPYFTMCILSLVFLPLAHKLLTKRILSVTNVRKVFQLFSCFVPAAALVLLAFIDSSQKALGIFLLMAAIGSSAGEFSGYMVNYIDLAPNYAGTLSGICNTTGTIASMLGPLTVGLLGNDKADPVLWRKVFCLAAGILAGTGVVYGVFGSGEKQLWNEPLSAKKDKKRSDKCIG